MDIKLLKIANDDRCDEYIPLEPLCKWLATYASPPGNESWLALYGSLEKAWAAVIKRDVIKNEIRLPNK